jgi:hypothetical protein
MEQKNGILTISRQSPGNGGLNALRSGLWRIDQIGFVEARLMLDSNIQASEGDIGIGMQTGDWWLNCSIYSRRGAGDAWATCADSEDHPRSGLSVQYNSWHTMRFEVNPNTAAISLFADGQQIGGFVPTNPDGFKKAQFNIGLSAWSKDGGVITGYIDDVRIGSLGTQ